MRPLNRRPAMVGACVFIVFVLLTAELPAQGRRIRRIPVPAPPATDGVDRDRPLPTKLQCETAVRSIAGAYGPDNLKSWLDEQFPNRSELLDALARLDLRVTGLELRVESLEQITLQPWRATAEGVTSDCVADLRTRLVFDDPATGRRTVGEPSRAQWRIRFSAPPSPGTEKKP